MRSLMVLFQRKVIASALVLALLVAESAGQNNDGDGDVVSVDGSAAAVECPFEYAPIECGEDAELFMNLCLAEAKGYTEEDCKSSEQVIEIALEDCPVGTFPCTLFSQPIMCMGCKYDNFCFAEE